MLSWASTTQQLLTDVKLTPVRAAVSGQRGVAAKAAKAALAAYVTAPRAALNSPSPT